MVEKDGKVTYYEYVEFEGDKLFTVICLPKKEGKFPTLILRSPYARPLTVQTIDEECEIRIDEYSNWTNAGFAVILQHCRGTGKSTGDFIPMQRDRADGRFLQDWIRKQPFYNGELVLFGESYDASVHYLTAPFAPDVKAAVLQVQDFNRYNAVYKNGVFKTNITGTWFADMYKLNSIKKRNYTPESYNMLPLKDFAKTVFNEEVESFNELLKHPDKTDEFWEKLDNGKEIRDAIKNTDVPILFVTGFYDIYTGAIFDMWNSLSPKTRANCALAVHPFDHSGTGLNQPVQFENGVLREAFKGYAESWLNAALGKCECPFEKGKVTYYKLFGDKWCTDNFETPKQSRRFKLGEGEVTYRYNPYNPASFKGGLSTNFGANDWQDKPNSRYDIVSLFTEEFSEDTFIKGKMKAKLKVKSTCEDTCFYVRISLCKDEGDYGLRDDINLISNFEANYTPNNEICMDFSFDEHAFVIKKGEKLRIDISSAANPHYLRHTNNKGLFSEQTTAKIADNTVVLGDSSIEIPIES